MRNKLAYLKPDSLGIFADGRTEAAAIISLIKRGYTIHQVVTTLGIKRAKVIAVADAYEKKKSK